MKNTTIIGTLVTVTVDRPMGSRHPRHPDLIYPLNYGYAEGVLGGDGEWQGAYLLGVPGPVSHFAGRVIAVIHRLNDNEDKWVVAPDGQSFKDAEILEAVRFQEQYFQSELLR